MNKTKQEFLLGDCLETLKSITDNSIDCILADGPYALKMSSWDTFTTNLHFKEFTEKWGRECYRVLKPGGTIASFNAARTYHWMAEALDTAGFECRDMLEHVFWAGMPKGRNLKNCHEPIYLGWKPAKKVSDMTFNIDDVRIKVQEKIKKDGTKEVAINNLKMVVTEINH